MKCWNCHALVEKGVSICSQCGATLDRKMPETTAFCLLCGYENNPESLHCTNCGSKLKSSANR